MEALTYSPARAADLLGVREKVVTQALDRVLYSAADVWALRQKLGLMPPALGSTRKQLFLNFKGGTGKTSVSSNYGFRMAEMGYRVLIIDLDSQGHATKCLGYEGEEFEKTLLDVLVKKVSLADVVQPTPMPNLSFVPSNLSMSTVDLALMPMAGREYKLRNALKDLDGQYDLILFDAPPSFGLLNLNALVAADDLFVPVLADFLSFHGLKLLFDTVNSLEEDLGHTLSNIFIVVNAFNQTFKLAKEALEALKTHYPEYLLPTVVRQCTKFAQASSEGVPVFVSAPDSKGAEDIQAVIDHVLKRLRPDVRRATK